MDNKHFYEEIQRRTEWFRNARFGAFIHFGLYAVPARGEWVMSAEKISVEDYREYFDEFNPVEYNPREWARLIKDAGMKYAVLTTKHHDGFCLFDSKYTEYKATNTPYKKDLIREYVDALREADIKVGLYYSLVDWHHEDYPAYGDRQHPMRDNAEYKEKSHNFDNYVEYMHNQVRELCTNYGKIDILWFDFSYWDKKGEAWKATELVKMIRGLQPDIIINNRLGGDMESENPEEFCGDFDAPEQAMPREQLKNADGCPLPWELNMTTNNSWGYCATDKLYKTPQFIIKNLVECVSKNGNLILNIGPNARGVIPRETADILEQVGDWMRVNGESIYGCGKSDSETPAWGMFTQKGNILYAHMFSMYLGHMNMKGMKEKIKKARLLCDGSEVIVTEFWNANNGVSKMDKPEDVYLALGNPANKTYDIPDKIDTVIKIYLNEMIWYNKSYSESRHDVV